MAGKTFPGIGELEDESPPVDPADAANSDANNSRPFYSGPTVVDDVKVEEGLKKLRSLDAPLGHLTGITKAVVDALESGPSGSVEVPIDLPSLDVPLQSLDVPLQSLDVPLAQPLPMTHPMRETAVGRNVVGPMTVEPESAPPFDDRAMRGTMFGHGIHAPEFALPAPEEPPMPGALALLKRGAPTKTAAIFPPHRTAAGPPTEPQPFPRAGQYRSTPLTPISVVDPPKKGLYIRIAIGGAAILAFVGILVFWARPSDDSDSSAAATAAANKIQTTGQAPPSTPTPPVATPPPAPFAAPTKPASNPASAGVAAVSPSAATKPVVDKAPAREPAADATKPPPTPTPTRTAPPVAKPAARRAAEEQSAVDTEEPVRAHHFHSAAPRRHGIDADKASDIGAPPVKPTRRRAPEDDPDATMAPSIE